MTDKGTMSSTKTVLKTEVEQRKLQAVTKDQAPTTGGELEARALLSEDAFVSMLYLERRRAERAQKRFVLVLVDVKRALDEGNKSKTLGKIGAALTNSTRETDILGWYLENNLIGVIGTELGDTPPKIIHERLLEKMRASFQHTVGKEKSSKISVSFHFFPEEYGKADSNGPANVALYPDISRKEDSKKVALGIKRAMDLVGSATALLLFSPVLAAIAVAIKLTSKGPILFRQERLGQYGHTFTFLKFRSMYTNCDAKIHQEYVNQFIAGQVDEMGPDGAKPVFKIQKDPRVTSVGRFLRKTSLDELPQFINVLRGEMSLVGPRPPIAYEFRAYDLWHRRRVLEIRPGITGLWQVEGRSRTRFDDMVRLDLKYARGWSIWLDVKILIQTPSAVFSGDGAH
jgi:lipopolysaccharide/colanic/teichoic acid biosynthesis glycosyltransferase